MSSMLSSSQKVYLDQMNKVAPTSRFPNTLSTMFTPVLQAPLDGVWGYLRKAKQNDEKEGMKDNALGQGLVDGIGGGIARNESMASATSTHNSDVSGNDATGNLVQDQRDVITYADVSPIPLGIPVVKTGPPQTSSSKPNVEFERSVPLYYTATTIPHQMRFPNQLLKNSGSILTHRQIRDNASGANSEDDIPSNNQNCLVPKDLLILDDSIPKTVQAELVVVAAAATFGVGSENDFLSGYPNYPDPKDHLSLDDLVTESVPVTHLVSTAACDDEVDDANNVICLSLDLIVSSYKNILNLQETLQGEMEINKAVPLEYDIESDAPKEVNQLASTLTDLGSNLGITGAYGHSNSELLNDVLDSWLAEQYQDSLHLTSSKQINQDLNSQVAPHQIHLGEDSKRLVSSPSHYFPKLGVHLEQVLDSVGKKLESSKPTVDPSEVPFPKFGLLPEATQVNPKGCHLCL
ncbi:hypothetical protein AAG906_013636 [Vitis piasezkii]